MKKILTLTSIILSLIPAISFCQKNNTGTIEGIVLPDQIDTIIQVDGVNKNDLYVRSKEWANSYFNSQKTVLQTDDKESGLLIYKFLTIGDDFTIKSGLQNVIVNQKLHTLLSIYIKDSKVRIILSNFNFTQNLNNYTGVYGKGYKYPEIEFTGKNIKYGLADGIDMAYNGFSQNFKIKLYKECGASAKKLVSLTNESAIRSFTSGVNKKSSNFDF